MMVHLFGAKSSPACASYALRKVADDNETHASQITLETVRDSFYVEDCLKSVDDVDVAIRLVKELDFLLKSGGFHLSKYISNCSSLLSEICGSDLSATIVNLEFDRLPVNKTLGVFWNTDSDNFEIKVRLKQKPPTRRGILSMASQIFDSFGLVQPHALPVKQLMQQLCEMNLRWDDSIPEYLEATWHRWVQALPKLEDVTVPRCFMPLENAGSIELHCFCDARETGYGAVCYFRIASGSSWCCQFVIGKSRVTPFKALSIPRL